MLCSRRNNPEFKVLVQHLYPGVSREKGVALDKRVAVVEVGDVRGLGRHAPDCSSSDDESA